VIFSKRARNTEEGLPQKTALHTEFIHFTGKPFDK